MYICTFIKSGSGISQYLRGKSCTTSELIAFLVLLNVVLSQNILYIFSVTLILFQIIDYVCVCIIIFVLGEHKRGTF